MQNQYIIEIFDRDFNFVGYSIVERPEIDLDYLTLEETTLRLPRITAGKGDFAHVTDLYGSVIYDGIVSDVRDDGAGVELKVAPLLSLFDVQESMTRKSSRRCRWRKPSRRSSQIPISKMRTVCKT